MKKLAIFCLLGLVMLAMPRPTRSVTMSIVTVTAYSYSGGRSPHGITASGRKVREGMVAVSRDLERNLRLVFGDRVLLHGLGVFEVQDRMASGQRKKVDLFMQSDAKARRFGVKRYIVLVKLA
jgi:3D (Asp-Asp-Asp) domain-containing protein|uniref:3D domain-containing protein n=1 Tax=Desulfobacca acetoxidans TaxID=60893 RepID=A0A7C3SK02_9BACT